MIYMGVLPPSFATPGRGPSQAKAQHHRTLAQASLRTRYDQLQAMHIEALPVVAIRIEHATSWGHLETTQGG